MSRLLVDMAERRWIAENAIKEIGTQIKFKVMDVDKIVPRIKKQREDFNLSPFIEIQPISVDMHKSPNRMPSFQKDPETGVFYGLLISVDQFGNPRWQRPVISDGLSLNMENLNDIKIWSVLRFHPDIEGSPFQRDYPIYRIWDPTDEAKSQINRNIAMKEAFKLTDLIKDKAKDLVNFARYLGEDVHSSSNHSIVYGMILKAAASDPYTFIRKWNNKTRGYAERFFSGVALGLINNEPDNGLVYRNITLGFSEEDAIQKLSEDPNLMKNLVMDISERDIVITKIDAELSRPTKKEIE